MPAYGRMRPDGAKFGAVVLNGNVLNKVQFGTIRLSGMHANLSNPDDGTVR